MNSYYFIGIVIVWTMDHFFLCWRCAVCGKKWMVLTGFGGDGISSLKRLR